MKVTDQLSRHCARVGSTYVDNKSRLKLTVLISNNATFVVNERVLVIAGQL